MPASSISRSTLAWSNGIVLTAFLPGAMFISLSLNCLGSRPFAPIPSCGSNLHHFARSGPARNARIGVRASHQVAIRRARNLVLPDRSDLSRSAKTGPADENFKAKPGCANSVSGETLGKVHNRRRKDAAAASSDGMLSRRSGRVEDGVRVMSEFHDFQTHRACRFGHAAGLHRLPTIRLGADAEEGRPAGGGRRFRAAQPQPGDRRLQRRLLHLQQDRRDAGRSLLRRQGRARAAPGAELGRRAPTACR